MGKLEKDQIPVLAERLRSTSKTSEEVDLRST